MPASRVRAEFSSEASVEFDKRVADYIESLRAVSSGIARAKSADVVSAHHVRVASEALGSGRASDRVRRVGEIGVLILGAGLGYLGNTVAAGAYTFANAAVIGVSLTVGAAMFMFSWSRS